MSTKLKPAFQPKRNTLSRAIRMACVVAAVIAAPYAQAGLITQNNVQALLVTESVANNAQQTTSTVGPLTNAGGYQGQSVTGAGGSNSSSLGVVPPNPTLGNTVYQNNADAANAVANYLSGSGGTGTWLQTIADTMSGAMKSSGSASGAQMGLFTFVQNVQIANPAGGAATQAQVYASVLVYPNGQYEFLGANVNNSSIFLLYANYQQSKNAYYLPAGWTVPYAGDLQWELLEVTMQGNTINGSVVPVGGQLLHVINDNGAYDGTVTMVNGKQQVNYGPAVQSLMTNQIDPLMKQNNATTGIVLYGEQVKVQRNSAGQPLTAINVQSRTLTSTCGGPGTLTSSGQYGYLLTELDNEYLVQSNGSYSQANQISQNTLSPNASFNESASVGNNAQYAQYVNDLAFPIAPDAGQLVNYTSGSPLPEGDYVGMAPLVQGTGNGNATTEINSVYGEINVCVPSQPQYTYSAVNYIPGGCNKNGCWPSYTSTAIANIAPMQINGNPDNFVCQNSQNIVDGENYLNCALEFNTTFYSGLWSQDIAGDSVSSAGLPVSYGLPSAWSNSLVTSGPPEGVIYSNYFTSLYPSPEEYAFAANGPGGLQGCALSVIGAPCGLYNCTSSGCSYSPPYVVAK